MAFELIEEEPQNEEMNFGEYAKEAGRHAGRTASNIATQAVGLPGDIFSLINDFIARPVVESVTGEEGATYEQTPLGKVLPTTETHRKNVENYFGENARPHNEVEKFADDIIEDATLLLSPTHIVKKGLKKGGNLLKNLFKSIGANVAGETTKQVLDSEAGGAGVKAGALFILSLIDQESAAKQVSKLYQDAEKHVPKNATTSAATLSKSIDSLENSITKGRPKGNLSAPEKFVVDQSDKIKNLISDGKINVEQAIAQKRSLNKELATLYQTVPGKTEQQGVRNLSKQLNKYLNATISEYGATNKKFFVPYKNADQAFGAIANSHFIGKWVSNNVTHSAITHGLMHLFGPVVQTAAIAAVPYQATKLLYRIKESPTLAKIYGNAMRSAAKEDSVAFNKYFKELDEALEKEESQDRYEFID